MFRCKLLRPIAAELYEVAVAMADGSYWREREERVGWENFSSIDPGCIEGGEGE